ncbi:RDD family protein [Wenyingzhuangia sp. IMCC45467]
MKNIETKTSNFEFKTEKNIGIRILAGIIDYSFILCFIFIFITTYGEVDNEGNYSVSGVLALFPLLFWGIMTIGIEQLFGATIGNFVVGLKPISIENLFKNETSENIYKKPTFNQSLKRHLLDPIDMLFIGIIGIITIKNTDKNQRLGDIWGNTIVIKESELKTKKT